MNIIRSIKTLRKSLNLWRLRRAGLTIGSNCSFAGLPDFGSEPYLISIGNNVAMAGDISFLTHDGGTQVFNRAERYRHVIKYGRIHILDNCVIGERVLILPGVTIGPTSVVAAGSVVTRNIPAGVLASGNPARPVMTTLQYAEWSLAATPDYNLQEYHCDKKKFLMKFPMRGASPAPTCQGGRSAIASDNAD